ncbi:MAG: Ca2+-dependent phosphoinositide-specific phospholipase C [Spirochaetia bacterium]
MFTSRPGEGPPSGVARPDAVVVIHNDPDPNSIAVLTAAGLIVRTRADGDGSFTPGQRMAAPASGAQIISTDLPPGHPNDSDLGVVEFAPGKTLTQVDITPR